MAMSRGSTGLAQQLKWTVRTTGAGATLQQWLNLPAAGDGATFNALISAQQDNGERTMLQTAVGSVLRNAIGVGAGMSISVGPNGSTDTVTVPWTTFVPPAGWSGTLIDLSASPIVSLAVIGAAAMNVDWLIDFEVYLFGGAQILNF